MKIQKITAILCVSALLTSCIESQRPDASGTFETVETVVSSEIAGRLLEFKVEEGFNLKEGDIVGKIDDLQYRLQVENLRAQIEALKHRTPEVALQLAGLEERLRKQFLEKERTEKLIAAKSENTKKLDDINSEIKYLKDSIAASKSTLDKQVAEIFATIKSLEVQIQQAQDSISKSVIKNPLNGTVIVKYAEANEVTSFGKPLYKIANLNDMRLRAYFSAADLSKLKIGQSLRVIADFGENQTREYEGVLIWVSEKSEFTPKGIRTRDERADLVYATKIAVKNDGYLKIGQYAEVLISNVE